MDRWLHRAGLVIGYGIVAGFCGAAVPASFLLWVQGFALTCRAFNP